MIHPLRQRLMLVALCALLSACNFNIEAPTPTVAVPETPTVAGTEASPTAEASLAPSLTPSTAPTVERVVLITPTPEAPIGPPTEPPTLTPTLGPYEVTVAPGDTLAGIVSRFGYRDLSVLRAITTLNPNVNVDNLQVNQPLLIPRMSPTPSPPGYEATAAMRATLGIRSPDQLAENTELVCHTVIEDENIISIASSYNTTLEIIARLNPEISFSGCDFDNRSGGETCNPSIFIGQCVTVPLPTATPTLSPTPSGNETATPTPTFAAPVVITPPDGVTVSGAVTVQWVSVGVLAPDEFYYVEVTDTTLNTRFTQVTKETSMPLPPALIPSDGQTHAMAWLVTVVRRNAGGGYAPIGGVMSVKTFNWQSR
ncbi:MAG: LysM peptidoglycan-binding domain-containing protein [Anaerolineae bacterium]|jgi:LysM repeat protein|nr:LysM peptidoglycan-binding domain-containing protein [Anaerolineae bacterium]